MLRAFIYRYKQSDLAKGFVALLTGSILAQAIPVAIFPLLTRIYSPSEFGVFALYMSISTILAAISTGKYELAIFLPENDDDAFSLVLLASGILIMLSSIFLIVFIVFREHIAILLGNSKIEIWLLFVPFSVFLTGVGNTLMYWHNRKRNYKVISVGKVVQSSSQASTNLIIGFSGLGVIGLVLSNIIGGTSRCLMYFKELYSDIKQEIKIFSIDRIRNQAVKYKKFPKYFVVGGFLNTLSNQLPILLFSTFYGSEIVGFLSLSQRIVMLPSSLISNSVGDVFRQQASEDYSQGSCRNLLILNVKRLFCIGLIPFLLLMIIAPHMFDIIFGKEWIESGVYVQILCLMFFSQFIFSALSSIVIQVSQKLEIDILWQLGLLMLTSVGISIGFYIYNNVYYSLLLFSIAYSIMYTLNFIMAYKFAKK